MGERKHTESHIIRDCSSVRAESVSNKIFGNNEVEIRRYENTIKNLLSILDNLNEIRQNTNSDEINYKVNRISELTLLILTKIQSGVDNDF